MKGISLPGGGELPKVGLGTWQMGGSMSADHSQDDQVLRALQDALELGYRHFDTAEMYGGGHTEELIGRAIRGVPRDELFITSKVWQTHLDEDAVVRAAEGSLRRLGLDRLDLYLIHWPDNSTPLSETFNGLNRLVHSGKVRWLGVSNFDLGQLRRAQRLSETPLAAVQVPYSLYHREVAQNGVLKYCQEHGMALIAYTPVEKGRIAQGGTLANIASKYNASPVQIALAWLVQQPQVAAIPKSMQRQHLRENLEAAEIQLSEEDIQELDRLKS